MNTKMSKTKDVYGAFHILIITILLLDKCITNYGCSEFNCEIIMLIHLSLGFCYNTILKNQIRKFMQEN